jgi:NADH-quinone oxidoreductase subunit I
MHYPHESVKMPARFRGHIELVRDPETGRAICYSCGLCQKACPSDCITVEGAKLDGAKKKSVTKYILDFTKCSLCGSCVEACRDSAIQFSRDYNLAGLSKEDYVMDLFKKLEDEARAEGILPRSPAPAPEAAPAPAAPTAAPAPAAAAAKPSAPAPAPTPAPAPKPESKPAEPQPSKELEAKQA